MANVERLHKIDEQINLAVDQIGQTFKERIQTILIDNQLSISREKKNRSKIDEKQKYLSRF